MDIGDKIKMLRAQQGLTLEEVGQRVGVGKSTVRKWESGQIANMRRDKIALLAQAFGVTPAYLMGWKESATAEPKQPTIPEDETRLLAAYHQLNADGRRLLLQTACGRAKHAAFSGVTSTGMSTPSTSSATSITKPVARQVSSKRPGQTASYRSRTHSAPS